MAEFKMSELAEDKITVLTVRGDIQQGEMLDFIKTCNYEDRHYRTLWDMREASWVNIPFPQLVSGLTTLLKYSRKGQKTAFVYGQDVDFGIGRMLEPHLRRFGIESKIWPFKDYDKAIAWLLDDSADEEEDDPWKFFNLFK